MDPSIPEVNISDYAAQAQNVSSSIWHDIMQQLSPKLDILFTIGKILLIVIIIYIIIRIIANIMKIRDTHNLSIIATNVVQINEKLTHLLDKKSQKLKKDKDKK